MTPGRKIIKWAAIGLGCITGLYLLALLVIGIYVNTKKESIIKYVTAELNDKTRGKTSIGRLEISVWRHFPNIEFIMEGFMLSDSVYNKPILSAKTFATTFSIFRFLSSKKTIDNIIIEDGSFHLFTDSSGYSNKYLLEFKKENTNGQKEQGSHAIKINAVSIHKLAVTIENKIANKEISFIVDDLNASVNQKGELMDIKMHEKTTMKKGLGFNLEKGTYLEKQTLEADWKLQMDNISKTLSFGKTKVKINERPYELSGHFSFTEKDPSFSIQFDVKDLPFSDAEAIVTDAIRKKIEMARIKEPLDVNGSITGSLLPNQEPAVNINWKTENNTLSTPVAIFSQCSFTGNFMNSVNKDSLHLDNNSRITFFSFVGNWDGINLSGKDITITNLLEPRLHFNLHSNCTLAALDDKLALKDILFEDGNADLDLFYDGPIAKNASMMQELEGKLTVKNGTIQYVPRNFTFTNCNGNIAFYKDSISIRKFSCSYLKNKFDIEVEGKNMRRKFAAGDLSQDAIIKCYVRSPHINLEDFKVLFAEEKQRTKLKLPPQSFAATARELDNLLDHSIIGVYIKAAEMKFQNIEAKNFDADIRFAPHQWEVARVSLNIAGGTIVTNGKIIHAANNNHDAEITSRIENVDVKKLFFAFDNFGQDAVTFNHLNGNFSTNVSLKAGINSQGKIIPASLYGTVDFTLKNGSLHRFPAMENLKTFVFKKRDMSDVRFAEIKDKLDIKGDNVFVNRMEIQSNVLRLFIEGNYGLNGKNTEMLIQVPVSNLSNKSFTDTNAPKNIGVKESAGLSVWLRAENDDTGKVNLKLTLNKKFKNKKAADKKAKTL